MRRLENKKLDEIGRAFVKASALPTREVEKIVSDTALFDSIRKRIALESKTKAERRWISGRVAAGMASVIVLTVVAAFFVFTPKPVNVVSVQPGMLPETPPAKRFTQPDRIIDRASLPEPVTLPRAERILNRANVKPSRQRQPTERRTGSEGDFYALSYAGDPNETERGGRIVRVDIPRTVLFAMGVDIPLENETETVKADLLIGTDGVTRAIRVVK